ncbi:hypothetical protein N0V82_009315 [Gnomoniopsis sp. IMI 355080]|nr:hypothetical protein N0V82_009315 [Gnomoniopsis sp. IMI 355080]
MPPRLSLRPFTGRSTSLRRVTDTNSTPSVCLFCSLAAPRSIPRRPRRKSLLTRRSQSTATATSTRASDARRELQEALKELQTSASNYVNLSRVQLALNALRQEAGDETVRVAILGLANGVGSGRTAKEVLRLLLADPLSPEQEWEKELAAHDASAPLIVRVGATAHGEGQAVEQGNMTYTKGDLLKEIYVSSPGLNGHKLEVLLMESNPLADASDGAYQGFEEAALVPTVEIPMSNTGRFTPITTPVHKALLVTEGFNGVASLMSLPLLAHEKTIAATVNLPDYHPEDGAALPFLPIDAAMARQGLEALRESPEKAFDYQHLWYKSNLPAIVEWLKTGATTTDNGATKDAVRNLVASVLRNTLISIQEEESRRLSSALSAQMTPAAIASLNKALADWSEKAHAELQGEMDRAFDSQRWSKLNWWKLFWRVDDVGVLSSEMLSTRFLPRAERNVIYLAGQVEGSGLFGPENGKTAYSLPAILSNPVSNSKPSESATAQPVSTKPTPGTKWPTHITFTRSYLQSETVPALQALAQKLVMQAASFSTLTSGLGALMYLSSFGISESGAVAAFGLVWSLRRVQKKWETAREYWQSEVREEGRKAVRAVELSVADALDKAVSKGSKSGDAALSGELKTARELVHKAEEALAKMK